MSFDNSQFRDEAKKAQDLIDEASEFHKLKKRGTIILSINMVLALIILAYYQITDMYSLWFYASLVYAIVSLIFLIRRVLKKEVPSKEDNYIFGEKLGNKMAKTPQKFILEAMMMSLFFIIITGIFSSIYAVFFTELDIVYKVIAGVSGFFGAIFMTMILISTFIQYKQLLMAQEFQNKMAMHVSEELRNSAIKSWLDKD